MISRHRTNIHRHESVVLYPSIGHLDKSEQNWRLWIQGAVFERGEVNLRKRLMLQLLRRAMDVDPVEFGSELFQERISGFLAQPEKGKRIHIRLAGKTYRLPRKTRRNGQFSGVLLVPRTEIATPIRTPSNGEADREGSRIETQLALDEGDEREILGEMHLLAPGGLSIISDIDDTIKHSGVTSRRELLSNTFLRQFRDVEGMADVYRQWGTAGAAFHYVSSSPWQLYAPLLAFRQSFFPPGSMHLRSFRLRDHMLRKLLLRRPGKSVVVGRLVQAFPQRRFILVGDSGEKDLEIYGRVARRFRRQVCAIMIRELDGRPLTPGRISRAMRGVDGNLLQIFRDSSELQVDLGPFGNAATRVPPHHRQLPHANA